MDLERWQPMQRRIDHAGQPPWFRLARLTRRMCGAGAVVRSDKIAAMAGSLRAAVQRQYPK
jgi:hypothetical protein